MSTISVMKSAFAVNTATSNEDTRVNQHRLIEQRVCSLCNGDGHATGSSLVCTECKGKGFVTIFLNTKKCMKCKGIGHDKNDCGKVVATKSLKELCGSHVMECANTLLGTVCGKSYARFSFLGVFWYAKRARKGGAISILFSKSHRITSEVKEFIEGYWNVDNIVMSQ